jgi:hypothetical protein
MYRNGHPASMLARHITTIPRVDGEQTHVPIAKTTWGPILWNFFHGMGALLIRVSNPEIRNSFTQQMWSYTRELLETVPCPYCRAHAIEEYDAKRGIENAANPETMNSYQRFFFDFHNRVNTRLNKPVVSYETMIEISRDINPQAKIQEYYRSINGYRIWKRRDEFMAKFNTFYSGIQETLLREATPPPENPITAPSSSVSHEPKTESIMEAIPAV